MPKRINLFGQAFGRLNVIAPNFRENDSYDTYWDCLCSCGKSVCTTTRNLRSGNTRSCGCARTEKIVKRNTTHGKSKTSAFTMWCSAKARARRLNLSFDISIADVIVPDKCPVLGIPLFQGVGTSVDNSPTLDRIDSKLGYRKENVKVISNRANRIKQNATAEELRSVATYVERETKASQ